MIPCARMSETSLEAAFGLLQAFLRDDEYDGDSSQAYGDRGGEAMREALRLLLVRPELGFVWLGYLSETPVAVCVVSFAVSTSIGGVVAKLDDVYVDPANRGTGVGTRHYMLLTAELQRLGIKRVDTSVHVENVGARRFYERLGFRSLREERLASVLG